MVNELNDLEQGRQQFNKNLGSLNRSISNFDSSIKDKVSAHITENKVGSIDTGSIDTGSINGYSFKYNNTIGRNIGNIDKSVSPVTEDFKRATNDLSSSVSMLTNQTDKMVTASDNFSDSASSIDDSVKDLSEVTEESSSKFKYATDGLKFAAKGLAAFGAVKAWQGTQVAARGAGKVAHAGARGVGKVASFAYDPLADAGDRLVKETIHDESMKGKSAEALKLGMLGGPAGLMLRNLFTSKGKDKEQSDTGPSVMGEAWSGLKDMVPSLSELSDKLNPLADWFKNIPRNEQPLGTVAFKEAIDGLPEDLEELQNKDGQYECPHCGRSFSKPRGLTTHMWKAHPTDDKKSDGSLLGKIGSEESPLVITPSAQYKQSMESAGTMGDKRIKIERQEKERLHKRGGMRPGAGRPKGSKNKQNIFEDIGSYDNPIHIAPSARYEEIHKIHHELLGSGKGRDLPRLATGGVLTSQTDITAGEGEPEIIGTPRKIISWLAKAVGELETEETGAKPKGMKDEIKLAFKEMGDEGIFSKVFGGAMQILRVTMGFAFPSFGSQYRAELPNIKRFGIFRGIYEVLALQYVHSRMGHDELIEAFMNQTKVMMMGFGIEGEPKDPRKPRSVMEMIGGIFKDQLGLGKTGEFIQDQIEEKTKKAANYIKEQTGIGEGPNKFTSKIPGYDEWLKKKEEDENKLKLKEKSIPAIQQKIDLLTNIRDILKEGITVFVKSAKSKPLKTLASAIQNPQEITEDGMAMLHSGETVIGNEKLKQLQSHFSVTASTDPIKRNVKSSAQSIINEKKVETREEENAKNLSVIAEKLESNQEYIEDRDKKDDVKEQFEENKEASGAKKTSKSTSEKATEAGETQQGGASQGFLGKIGGAISGGFFGFFKTIKNAILGVWEKVTEMAKGIWELPSKIAEAVSGVKKGVSEKGLVGFISEKLDTYIKQPINQFLEGLKTQHTEFGRMFTAFSDMKDTMYNAFSKDSDEGFFQKISSVFKLLPLEVNKIFKSISLNMKVLFKKSLDEFEDGFLKKVVTIWQEVIPNAVKSPLGKAWDIINEGVTSLAQTVNVLFTAVGSLQTAIINYSKGIKEAFEGKAKDSKGKGFIPALKASFTGLVPFFKQLKEDIGGEIGTLGQMIWGAITGEDVTAGATEVADLKMDVLNIQAGGEVRKAAVEQVLSKRLSYIYKWMDDIFVSAMTAMGKIFNTIFTGGEKKWAERGDTMFVQIKDFLHEATLPISEMLLYGPDGTPEEPTGGVLGGLKVLGRYIYDTFKDDKLGIFKNFWMDMRQLFSTDEGIPSLVIGLKELVRKIKDSVDILKDNANVEEIRSRESSREKARKAGRDASKFSNTDGEVLPSLDAAKVEPYEVKEDGDATLHKGELVGTPSALSEIGKSIAGVGTTSVIGSTIKDVAGTTLGPATGAIVSALSSTAVKMAMNEIEEAGETDPEKLKASAKGDKALTALLGSVGFTIGKEMLNVAGAGPVASVISGLLMSHGVTGAFNKLKGMKEGSVESPDSKSKKAMNIALEAAGWGAGTAAAVTAAPVIGTGVLAATIGAVSSSIITKGMQHAYTKVNEAKSAKETSMEASDVFGIHSMPSLSARDSAWVASDTADVTVHKGELIADPPKIVGYLTAALEKLGLKKGSGDVSESGSLTEYQSAVVGRLDTIIDLLRNGVSGGSGKQDKPGVLGKLARIPVDVVSGVTKGVGGAMGQLGSIVGKILKAPITILNEGIKAVGTIVQTGFKALSGAIDGLKATMKAGWAVITAPLKALKAAIFKPFQALSEKFGKAKDAVKTKVMGSLKGESLIGRDKDGKPIMASWPNKIIAELRKIKKHTFGLHFIAKERYGKEIEKEKEEKHKDSFIGKIKESIDLKINQAKTKVKGMLGFGDVDGATPGENAINTTLNKMLQVSEASQEIQEEQKELQEDNLKENTKARKGDFWERMREKKERAKEGAKGFLKMLTGGVGEIGGGIAGLLGRLLGIGGGATAGRVAGGAAGGLLGGLGRLLGIGGGAVTSTAGAAGGGAMLRGLLLGGASKLAPPLMMMKGLWDAGQGAMNAGDYFGKGKGGEREGQEVTMGERMAGGLGGALSGATFGLLDPKEAVQGVYDAFKPLGELMEPLKELGGVVGDIFGALKDVFVTIIEAVKPWVSAGYKTIFATLKFALGAMVGGIKTVIKVIKWMLVPVQLLVKAIGGIVSGISDAMSWAAKELSSVSIMGFKPFAFLEEASKESTDTKISSPNSMEDLAKVAEEDIDTSIPKTKDIKTGSISGKAGETESDKPIATESSRVDDSMSVKIAKHMTDATDILEKMLVDGLSDFFTALGDLFIKAKDWIVEKAASIGDYIGDSFTNFVDMLRNSVADVIEIVLPSAFNINKKIANMVRPEGQKTPLTDTFLEEVTRGDKEFTLMGMFDSIRDSIAQQIDSIFPSAFGINNTLSNLFRNEVEEFEAEEMEQITPIQFNLADLLGKIKDSILGSMQDMMKDLPGVGGMMDSVMGFFGSDEYESTTPTSMAEKASSGIKDRTQARLDKKKQSMRTKADRVRKSGRTSGTFTEDLSHVSPVIGANSIPMENLDKQPSSVEGFTEQPTTGALPVAPEQKDEKSWWQFSKGGRVPGKEGEPVSATVHGGESVIDSQSSKTWTKLFTAMLDNLGFISEGTKSMIDYLKDISKSTSYTANAHKRMIETEEVRIGQQLTMLDSQRGSMSDEAYAAQYQQIMSSSKYGMGGVMAGLVSPESAGSRHSRGTGVNIPTSGKSYGGVSSPVMSAEAAQAAATGNQELGSLSARYESGSEGSSAIGEDSTGGASYGKYQIATKVGSMRTFMKFLQKHNPEVFERLARHRDAHNTKGNFANEWKSLAAEGVLTPIEHEFIKQKYYDKSLRRMKKHDAKKMVTSSRALQDVLWSTAVQHGSVGAPKIFDGVYKDDIPESDYIKGIYSKRATQFGSSTAAVRASVQNRFKREEQIALAMMNKSSTQEEKPEVQSFEKGGLVKGSIGQEVPINAHGGEYVVPQKTVSKIGGEQELKNLVESAEGARDMTRSYGEAKGVINDAKDAKKVVGWMDGIFNGSISDVFSRITDKFSGSNIVDMLKGIANKALGSKAMSMLKFVSGKVALPLLIGNTLYDIGKGWVDAGSNFDLGDEEANIGQKMSSSLAEVFNSQLPLDVLGLSKPQVAKTIYGMPDYIKGLFSGPDESSKMDSGGLSKVFGFETGGVVPGPKGQAIPAIVHGQETVVDSNSSVTWTGQFDTMTSLLTDIASNTNKMCQIMVNGTSGINSEDVVNHGVGYDKANSDRMVKQTAEENKKLKNSFTDTANNLVQTVVNNNVRNTSNSTSNTMISPSMGGGGGGKPVIDDSLSKVLNGRF